MCVHNTLHAIKKNLIIVALFQIVIYYNVAIHYDKNRWIIFNFFNIFKILKLFLKYILRIIIIFYGRD